MIMNTGIIAVEEERDKINEMSKKYIELYKKSLERDDKIDKISLISRWGIKIGAFVGHIKVAFSNKNWIRKNIDHGLITLSSKLSQWGIKRIANKQKENNQKEREEIQASFINDDGSIKEFLLIDDNLVTNQEITNQEDKTVALSI